MKLLSYVLVVFMILFAIPVLGGQDLKGPSINFSAQLTESNIIITYNIPNGYYTYLASPYASPLKIEVRDNDYIDFGKSVFPAGSRKGNEITLLGSGTITIPILDGGDLDLPSVISLKLAVSYQLCHASQGVCYSPVKKVLSFKLQQIKAYPKNPDFYEKDDSKDGSKNDSKDDSYRGKNSGQLIKSKVEGFRPLSHKLKKITVHNRVRITLKVRSGYRVLCFAYNRINHRKNHFVYKPRNIVTSTADGKYTVELFFPEANEYTVYFSGRSNKSSKYKNLFSYRVVSKAGFAKKDIPAKPLARFHSDGFKLISHKKAYIKARHELVIKIKGNANSYLYATLRDEKSRAYYSPWQTKQVEKDGTTSFIMTFPKTGIYTFRVSGRKNRKDKESYNYLTYKISCTKAYSKKDILARALVRFHSDGFKLISHKKTYINARKKLIIKIKGHKNVRLYATLKDENYKRYGSPWNTERVEKDGTVSFIITFPKTGQYTLGISGKEDARGTKKHHYFTYKINCTQAYSLDALPVLINKDFTKFGFTRAGLSHIKYYVSTGRNVKIVLRGKPGLELKASYRKYKPWKLYKYSPRIFVMSQQGKYTVQAYFPKAGQYMLDIKLNVTKKGDKYRKYSKIASYEISANGGYGDRALDIKMGAYISDDKYKVKPKKVKPKKKKVIFGSGGDLLWVKDMRQAERISKSQSKIILILHSASWCGYCKKLKKETFRDPDVVRYARSRFVAIEVGSSKIKNMALYKAKYKKHRSGIPSVSFIAPDGKHLLTRKGYLAGSYYLKVLKNVVAIKGGLIARYERLHKQGVTSYSYKLLKLYQRLRQKYKATQIIIDLLNRDEISDEELPKYYLKVSDGSRGKYKTKYLNKIIKGYSYQIGYYWYSAVFEMGIHLYGGGYGGRTERALNRNENDAITFLQKHARITYYSPMWHARYINLIQNIKKAATKKRKRKGWSKY